MFSDEKCKQKLRRNLESCHIQTQIYHSQNSVIFKKHISFIFHSPYLISQDREPVVVIDSTCLLASHNLSIKYCFQSQMQILKFVYSLLIQIHICVCMYLFKIFNSLVFKILEWSETVCILRFCNFETSLCCIAVI